MMRNFFGTLSLLIATTPLVASGQEVLESAACVESGTEILVVAQRLAEGPPAYTFTVVNGTESRVFNVSLGRGARLHGSPHLPTSMGAPMGWKASYLFGHESPYLHYLWTAETPAAQVQEGQSLSGFSVQLPAWEPEQPRFFLDEPVVQVDLRSIPFFVLLANGACYTGTAAELAGDALVVQTLAPELNSVQLGTMEALSEEQRQDVVGEHIGFRFLQDLNSDGQQELILLGSYADGDGRRGFALIARPEAGQWVRSQLLTFERDFVIGLGFDDRLAVNFCTGCDSGGLIEWTGVAYEFIRYPPPGVPGVE